MKVIAENSKSEYSFVRIVHKTDYMSPLHWQRGLEIFHIIKGTYKVWYNNMEFTAKTGDILVFDSGSTHSLIPQEEGYVDVVIAGASVLSKFFTNSEHVKAHITKQSLIENSIYEELNLIFDSMAKWTEEKNEYSGIVVQSEMIKLWSILLSYYKDNKAKELSRTAMFAKFQILLKYIDENYDELLNLESISKVVNYTPKYVSKLFGEFTGTTFKKYVNNIRISKACEFLQTTDYSMSEIALYTGFESIRSFNENFKKIINCTPREYKSSLK